MGHTFKVFNAMEIDANPHDTGCFCISKAEYTLHVSTRMVSADKTWQNWQYILTAFHTTFVSSQDDHWKGNENLSFSAQNLEVHLWIISCPCVSSAILWQRENTRKPCQRRMQSIRLIMAYERTKYVAFDWFLLDCIPQKPRIRIPRSYQTFLFPTFWVCASSEWTVENTPRGEPVKQSFKILLTIQPLQMLHNDALGLLCDWSRHKHNETWSLHKYHLCWRNHLDEMHLSIQVRRSHVTYAGRHLV